MARGTAFTCASAGLNVPPPSLSGFLFEGGPASRVLGVWEVNLRSGEALTHQLDADQYTIHVYEPQVRAEPVAVRHIFLQPHSFAVHQIVVRGSGLRVEGLGLRLSFWSIDAMYLTLAPPETSMVSTSITLTTSKMFSTVVPDPLSGRVSPPLAPVEA